MVNTKRKTIKVFAQGNGFVLRVDGINTNDAQNIEQEMASINTPINLGLTSEGILYITITIGRKKIAHSVASATTDPREKLYAFCTEKLHIPAECIKLRH